MLSGCVAPHGHAAWELVTRFPLATPTPSASAEPIAAPTFQPVVQTDTDRGLRVPILLYHRVGQPDTWHPQLFVTPEKFTAQMAALASAHVATLSMEDLVTAVRSKQRFPHGAVALTFDDGSEDQYQTTFPILKRYKIHATLFIPTGLVGRGGYLTWPQLQEMVGSGLITAEAHSISHPDLTHLSLDMAWQEISSSRQILQQVLGAPVSVFAYPFGRFDPEIERLVARAGFAAALTTKWRWTHSLDDALVWGRMEVHDNSVAAYLAQLGRMSGTWVPVYS